MLHSNEMSRGHDFRRLIERAWKKRDSMLCVGLDPRLDSMPKKFESDPDNVLEFCKTIVDATLPYVCAYKPNHAFFASLGLEDELEGLIDFIHHRDIDTPVILDAKRGDIGATAERYAIEAFDRYNADAVTVNPFLGWDSVEPFLEWDDRGVFVLCRTSNDGSDWLQSQPNGNPLYKQIAAQVESLDNDNVGLVVGATHLLELSEIRDIAPSTVLLIPGVGAQGAEVEDVLDATESGGSHDVIINVSRGITNQDETRKYESTVRTMAMEFAEQMRPNV